MNAFLLWSLQCFIMTAIMIPVVMSLNAYFRYRPAIQHALWVIVLLKFVTPEILTWPWHLPDLRDRVPSHLQEQISALSFTKLRSITDSTSQGIDSAPLPYHQQQTQVRRATLTGLPNVGVVDAMKGILLLGWFVGSVTFAIRQYRWVQRKANLIRSGTSAPSALSDVVREVSDHFGLKPVPLLVIPGTASPFVWCLGRLTLAWPGQMLHAETESTSHAIIAHELAHLCRRDHWIAWLELIAATVWWWNPLFWFVRRNLRASAEMACDALALEAYPQHRCAYAELLLELSTVPKNRSSTLVLSVSDSTPSHFERRMSMIVSERASGRLTRAGIFLAIALALVSIPIWSFSRVNEERQRAFAAVKLARQAVVALNQIEVKSPSVRNFAVFPVKTALQRRQMGWPTEDRSNARAYVLINGMAVCNDAGLIDEKALDMQALRTALAQYADDKKGVVFMNVEYNAFPARNHNAEKLVVWGLEGLGKDIGFKSARGVVTYHQDLRFEWEKEIALMKRIADQPDEDEEAVGDDTVQVYPVRTTLSAVLTHADCFVDILSPPNEDSETVLPQSVRQAIEKAIGEVKLRDQRMVSYSVQLSKVNDLQRDQLFRELEQLTKLLGFAGSSVSTR